MQENKVQLTKEIKIMFLKALKEGCIDKNELVKKLNLNVLDVEQITGMIVK